MNMISQPVASSSVEEILDLLLAGRYLSVPEGTDAVTAKLKHLADTLHGRAVNEVKRVVAISITCAEAVTATAEMTRDVRDVDGRAQAIAAAAEEMVASVAEIARSTDAVAEDAAQAHSA
ncbi:MAG: chemotaxis protein, partial [Caenispirillum bisanense]|nr:chemotaxis protein [Caenispirillum bisanense]MCA1972723.1 chemotaxis protein [Caenispirillum sp.]